MQPSGKESDATFEPLSPAAFHILLSLVDNDRHGYAIMQEIAQRTSGKMRVGPGTLYRSVKQMVESGWITDADERPTPEFGNERRKYYQITAQGMRVAAAEAQRLEDLVRVSYAKQLLRGASNNVRGGV